ncbi:restriction endonuclease subunit S [uncultured Treponema sp.]|uniref:restriction endonuclease subunit S n=1 Tax=uncultured Treponema sp. TaxID=162155 RepID=UPI00260082CE|nr:restriction endonuclease subunit S [uncultured Treponema sp.]
MKTEYIKFQNFIDSTQYGYTADETSFENGDCKYLRITDIVPYFVEKETVPFCKIPEEKKAQYMITDGDLLIARTGATTGYNLIVDDSFKNFIFASYLIRFNYDKKKLFPLYVKYVLKSKLWYGFVNNYISGSAQPGMNARVFGKFNFPYVPLSTQQKIASILSAYDKLIQNYKKQIEALQTAASELYKEWFVRFRFLGWKNAKFENGIPEGWKIERLGNLFEITSSKRVFEEDYVNEGIPFYRSKEIIELSNNQEITTELFISNELYAKFKNKFGVPKENDILITSVGSIGNSYQVRKDDIFYFKDGNLTWIKSSSKKALSKYLIYWLKSDLGKNTLISSTIGTSQSALTIEKLRAIKILVPEVNILEKFEQKISSFDIKIQILNKQIANLTQQRDLLLPRLMSGKLEV